MTRITRRAFAGMASMGAISLAAPRALAAAGKAAAPFDPLPYVHPDLRAMVAGALPMLRRAIPDEAFIAKARADSGRYQSPPAAEPAWQERKIPGQPGQPEVTVFVINAGQRAAPRPAILHIHGGGYILGSARNDLANLQGLARELDCVIVTVEYRLAPETRFPGALEDNYAALKWLHANAAELGVDPARIALKGESAGGGHAAMLAIAARDRGEVPVAFQCLIYPMLDDRTGSTVERPPQQGALMWQPESNRTGWSALLGQPAGSRKVPKGAVPAREANLAGLPPAFIGVGTIDLFYEEDLEYARRLAAAGVEVELVVAPGCFHGFDFFTTAAVTQRYLAHMKAALRKGLGL